MFKIGDLVKAASNVDEYYFHCCLPWYKHGDTLVVLDVTEKYLYVKRLSGNYATSAFLRRVVLVDHLIPDDGEWE